MDNMVALAYPQSKTDMPRRPDRRIAARDPFESSNSTNESTLAWIVREITDSLSSSMSGSEAVVDTLRSLAIVFDSIQDPVQILKATHTSHSENGMGTMVPEVGLALTGLYQRLAEFSELDEDWDSYGARTVSPRAVDAAWRFLESLTRMTSPAMRRQVVSAHIAPLPNGGILFEWTGATADLEVEVTSEGALDLFLEKRMDDEPEYTERSGVGVEEVTPLLNVVLSA